MKKLQRSLHVKAKNYPNIHEVRVQVVISCLSQVSQKKVHYLELEEWLKIRSQPDANLEKSRSYEDLEDPKRISADKIRKLKLKYDDTYAVCPHAEVYAEKYRNLGSSYYVLIRNIDLVRLNHGVNLIKVYSSHTLAQRNSRKKIKAKKQQADLNQQTKHVLNPRATKSASKTETQAAVVRKKKINKTEQPTDDTTVQLNKTVSSSAATKTVQASEPDNSGIPFCTLGTYIDTHWQDKSEENPEQVGMQDMPDRFGESLNTLLNDKKWIEDMEISEPVLATSDIASLSELGFFKPKGINNPALAIDPMPEPDFSYFDSDNEPMLDF